jgi:SAM-dependent methyltransferase
VKGRKTVARTSAFEADAARYDAWFERHRAAYLSELLALRAFVPWSGRGLEIGVGTGRFAAPLGIAVGVDPSPSMLRMAAGRGVECKEGVAEDLAFADASFDHTLVVTTICFVDSPARMLSEARRVLKPGGALVLGFIDRESPLGREYLAHQAESAFYREATFFSVTEVEALLRAAGFGVRDWGQTLAHSPADTREIEPLQPGRGRCSFVVVRAVSPG